MTTNNTAWVILWTHRTNTGAIRQDIAGVFSSVEELRQAEIQLGQHPNNLHIWSGKFQMNELKNLLG